MTSRLKATARHPRGWDKVVAQLNNMTDATEFLRGMLDVQCKVVAAEYGAVWVPKGEKEVGLVETWPPQLVGAGPDNPILKLLGDAARSGFEKGLSHVLKIEAEGSDTGELGAHVFVTPLRSGEQVRAVCTVVAECRDTQVLQLTAPLRELAAGLYEGFEARLQTRRQQEEVDRVSRAMALLAVCQEAKGFSGSCLNLVNELARQLKCTRVSLGWVRGKGVRLIAMSDTEDLKRHSEQVALVELAQAECLDQEQPIVFPIDDKAEPMLLQAVVHAHRRVTGGHPNRHVLSIPLRDRDEWLGAITFERTDTAFDPAAIAQLQLVADVIAPHLNDRKQSDRWLGGHVLHSIEEAGKFLVGPRYVAWKLGALVLGMVLLYSVIAHWDYKISADVVLEAQSRRIMPAPFQGNLRTVLVEPGDHVEEGEILAELDATELKLQLVEEQARLNVTRLQKMQATSESKIAEAQQAQANIERIQARIDLLEYQIDHSIIRSPISGYVLTGYWLDKIGGVVQLGEKLFEIAPLEDLTAVVYVKETDVDQVQRFIQHEETTPPGSMTTRSQPEDAFDLVVRQIVPAAAPRDGENVFEIRCSIQDPAIWLRPGMEGLAKINVGERRLIWIATHKVVDTVRLWFWW